MPDTDFNLQRFVDAQERGGAYERALAELCAGLKQGHWMWFLFPQLAGLGSSATARFFAIAGLDEASAYLAHPLLGPRLVACGEALLALPGADPVAVLGEIDALKLRSSMTLFSQVADAAPAFKRVLDRFYGGDPDPATERLLGA